jgi:molybdopterin molybdotransferase
VTSQPLTRLSFPDALAAVLDGARPLDTEIVPLRAALGRALAARAVSPVALPPWDNAAMDGYAVRATDVLGASAARAVALRVVGEVAAGGDASTVHVGPNEAIRISTGAPVPPGADAVVRVEDTAAGPDVVRVTDDRDVRGPTPAQRNVRPRGEDVRAGEAVLDAGTTVTPAQLGVLASIGCADVSVVRRPRVALVSSGDELVDVDGFDEVRAGRRIVSSNSYALLAQAQLAGAAAVDHGVARDDLGALRDRLADALDAGCDVLVTSGGISVGDHDHTRDALSALGLTQRFWRVRMRPGGPFGFGVVSRGGREVPWLGLPGNPVSAMVTFELFGRPLLRTLAGHRRVFRRTVQVTLAESVRAAAPLTHFLRATLAAQDDGRLAARLTGAQGSNLLTSMARADALLVVPEDVREAPPGTVLRALLLGDDALDTHERPL